MTSTASAPMGMHPWTRPYFEGVAQQELRYQQCSDCDRTLFPPRRFCPICASENLAWKTSERGQGKIYSHTRVDFGALPEFAADMPYIIAIVELDEGFRMLTRVKVADVNNVKCEDRVEVSFAPGGPAVPYFRPA